MESIDKLITASKPFGPIEMANQLIQQPAVKPDKNIDWGYTFAVIVGTAVVILVIQEINRKPKKNNTSTVAVVEIPKVDPGNNQVNPSSVHTSDQQPITGNA